MTPMQELSDESGDYKKLLPHENIVFKGKLFEIVHQYIQYRKGTISGQFEQEIARRTPGVRAIVKDLDQNILILKEYRTEHLGWDYRLPGGKVFDSIEDFISASGSGELNRYVVSAVKKEVLEETGIRIDVPKLICITKAGASIEWDLYYFEAAALSFMKSNLQADEIIDFEWKSLEEVKKLCLNGSIKEDRTVGVLLKYIIGRSS
jgi:ADP-ribose pyrophosphatase